MKEPLGVPAAMTGSIVDMSLEDVIKQKSKLGSGGEGGKNERRGGRSGKRGGRNRGGKEGGVGDLKATIKSDASSKRRSRGGRGRKRVRASDVAVAKNSDSAKATKAAEYAMKPTEDKLQMSLDDVIKTQVKDRRPRGEKTKSLKLKKDGMAQKVKAKVQANAKAKKDAGSGGAPGRTAASSRGGRRRGGRQRSGAARGEAVAATWSGGGGAPKKRSLDAWGSGGFYEPPEKRRMRDSGWSAYDEPSWGKGRSRGVARPDWPAALPPMRMGDARRDRMIREGMGYGSGQQVGSRSGGGCRICVRGIPRNLQSKDIQEAFEDTGYVSRCVLKDGVAWITYESPKDARKAVQTFDRGELNGKPIFVTLE